MLKKIMSYSLLVCFLCTFPLTQLKAENPPECPCQTKEDIQRSKTAVVVAGVTVVALVGGVAALAFGGCGHHHSHYSPSYSSSSYSSYSSESSYSYPSSYSYSNDYSHSSEYYSHYGSGYNEDNLIDDRITRDNKSEGKPTKSHSHQTKSLSTASKEEIQLTVNFTSLFSNSSKVNYTPFVQLPNGSTQMLGALSSSDKNQTLTFGPYHEKGTYHFGVSVNSSNSNIQLANINVTLDGKTVQNETLSSQMRQTLSYSTP